MKYEWNLEQECVALVRKLMAKHAFLQPANRDFDVWDKDDAAEVLADLIEEIKYSSEINLAHNGNDWGK